MIVAGLNLYRVTYKMKAPIADHQDFVRLVIAHSGKEAMAEIEGAYQAVLVDEDISMLIPSRYIQKETT
jgi:hypothetical protein